MLKANDRYPDPVSCSAVIAAAIALRSEYGIRFAMMVGNETLWIRSYFAMDPESPRVMMSRSYMKGRKVYVESHAASFFYDTFDCPEDAARKAAEMHEYAVGL